MGYTIEFEGVMKISPPLSDKEANFINEFSETRRMRNTRSPYWTGGGRSGFGIDRSIVSDMNMPPKEQPGLWCNWVITKSIGDRNDIQHPQEELEWEEAPWDQIEWNGAEKFYSSPEWMVYIIDHFLGREPHAQKELPFLLGNHMVNGEIFAQGENFSDRWVLVVEDNKVFTRDAKQVAFGPKKLV
jgi:hypothetical protein